jgi:hypothetical protein
MNVIRHQAEGQNPDLGIRQILAQKAQVSRAVVIDREGFPPIDSSLRYVTRNSR